MSTYDDGATTSWASPEQLCAILYVRAYREGDSEAVARIRSIWDALRKSSEAPKDDRPTLWGIPIEVRPSLSEGCYVASFDRFGNVIDACRIENTRTEEPGDEAP